LAGRRPVPLRVLREVPREAAVMSPHGDLIQAILAIVLFAGVPVGVSVWYYLLLRVREYQERVRHNRAVEKASWRLYWQIRKLATDDDAEAETRVGQRQSGIDPSSNINVLRRRS
jgi:hypothetical protein